MHQLTQPQALQIMIQALDIVIGKSGLNRQMIVDVDAAIKVFTDAPPPGDNGKTVKEIEKKAEKA